MKGVRNLQDILADMRNECISGIASIQLVKKGKYTEVQAFINNLRQFNKMIEYISEAEKLLTTHPKENDIWNE